MQLQFRPEVGEARSVPIEDIGFVVIENQQISCTIPLLNALVAHNVAVVICNEKHLPVSMLLNLDGHTIQTELFGHQLRASVPLKKQLWKQTVEAKIHNQATLLQILGKSHGELFALAKKVTSGDSTKREGVAARFYWSSLFGKGFVRDRYGNPPNMLLNYGYAILRAAVARALSGSGLLSTLGIFHHNRYNSFCLADDIMEPYRPFVDMYVYRIFQQKPELIEVETNDKLELLKVLTADVLINKNMRPVMLAISQTTASLARCFALESKRIAYPGFAKP